MNLSAFSDADYRADVWYWKANRSNLAGYADDIPFSADQNFLFGVSILSLYSNALDITSPLELCKVGFALHVTYKKAAVPVRGQRLLPW